MLFLIAAFLSLLSQVFFFTPLFFLLHLYLANRSLSVPMAIVAGLAIDLFWVYPLGLTGLFLLGFLLFLELYSKKYNNRNVFFLLAFLTMSTLIWAGLTGATLGYWHLMVFGISLWWQYRWINRHAMLKVH